MVTARRAVLIHSGRNGSPLCARASSWRSRQRASARESRGVRRSRRAANAVASESTRRYRPRSTSLRSCASVSAWAGSTLMRGAGGALDAGGTAPAGGAGAAHSTMSAPHARAARDDGRPEVIMVIGGRLGGGAYRERMHRVWRLLKSIDRPRCRAYAFDLDPRPFHREAAMDHPSPTATQRYALLLLAALILAPASQAGIGGALKKKAGDAAKKAENEASKAVEKSDAEKPKTEGAATPTDAASEDASSAAGDAKKADATPGGAQTISAVSTKFDYVPGDKVMLLDDFTQDELGEFPAHWRLTQGTFEVVEASGERWLRCTSVDGRVRMKLPAMATLPEFWTLEFDFYGEEPMPSALTVIGMAQGDHAVWEATFPHSEKNM